MGFLVSFLFFLTTPVSSVLYTYSQARSFFEALVIAEEPTNSLNIPQILLSDRLAYSTDPLVAFIFRLYDAEFSLFSLAPAFSSLSGIAASPPRTDYEFLSVIRDNGDFFRTVRSLSALDIALMGDFPLEGTPDVKFALGKRLLVLQGRLRHLQAVVDRLCLLLDSLVLNVALNVFQDDATVDLRPFTASKALISEALEILTPSALCTALIRLMQEGAGGGRLHGVLELLREGEFLENQVKLRLEMFARK